MCKVIYEGKSRAVALKTAKNRGISVGNVPQGTYYVIKSHITGSHNLLVWKRRTNDVLSIGADGIPYYAGYQK